MLSRDNFIQALAYGNLKIFPFDKRNLTGIGYNLSTTDFAFSISRGILLTIHQEAQNNGIRRYVIIPGNDTVLFFSKEYIEIDSTLAGTFHSKVSRVTQGLGHISTTLDPTWKGQLLISVNNPTSSEIEFDLAKNGGNITTLLLHKLDAEVTGENVHDNDKGRCDLLIAHFAKPFSNKKYQEKHLELEHFIRKDLAISLNGTDNFTSSDEPADEYSIQLKELQLLLHRLKNDRKIIQEGRYILENDGKYCCLNSREIELIKRCTLFSIKLHCNGSSESDFCQGIQKSELLTAAIPLIDICINVIDYEIASIDHIRRIRWQNEKVSQFANEDSALVKIRKSAAKRNRRYFIFGLPLLFLGCTGILLFALTHGVLSNANNIGLFAVTIYASISAVLFEFWIKTLRGFKNNAD